MSMFSSWFGARRSQNPNQSQPARGMRKPHRARLKVERLEGRALPSTMVISGYVFNDLNNSGIYQPGDPPIANSQIDLLNASNVVIGTAVTDSNGFYSFSTDSSINTNPTTQTQTATVPSQTTDWTQVLDIPQFNPSLGTLTGIDITSAGSFVSDIKVESLDSAPSVITATDSGTLTLTGPGVSGLVTSVSTSETFDASAYDGVLNFSGTSGHDFGPQTAPGSQTVTLSLPSDLALFEGTGTVSFTDVAHATSSATGAGNLVSEITTTASGQLTVVYDYIPSNALRPGTYVVVLTSQPSGYLPGLESSNGVVLPNSVGNDSIPVTLVAGSSTNNNFAELKPASLAGYVYVDANDNGVMDPGDMGIGGVTVTLSGLSDLGTVNLSTTTAADGSYSFGVLRPGQYTITETPPPNYLQGINSVGSLGGVKNADQFTAINVMPGASGINYDFAELQPASLSGFVYLDSNDNGIFESNDPGIAGVAVTLTGTTDQGDSIAISERTGAGGGYDFTALRPGTYTLSDVQPSAYVAGKESVGSLGGTAGPNQITNIHVAPAANGINYNFAELLPASLSGFVYLQSNGDSTFEYNESGIAGVTVTLTGTTDQGASVDVSQQTGSGGGYQFTGLQPGIYTIADVQPSAYLAGNESLGSLGGTIGPNQFSNIHVAEAANGINYNFGELLPARPTGEVYADSYVPGSSSFLPLPPVSILSKLQLLSSSSGQLDPTLLAEATFVNGLYITLLGREADSAGLTNWVIALNDGVSREQVVQAIWDSAEHRGIEVDEFYATFLHRSETAAERAAWVNLLLSGESETQVAEQFILSPEFQADNASNALFVSALYADVLGRGASSAEISSWVQALANGASRATVAMDFLTSTEAYVDLLNTAYSNILHRAPDAAGEQAWLAQLTSGQVAPQEVSILFLASDEFYSMAVAASQSA